MTMISTLRRAVEINPRGLAIVQGEERHTWPEYVARVARIAGGLQARGLRPGQPVALIFLNSPAFLETFLATWWAGGLVVPINTRMAWAEVRYILENSGAPYLITDENFADFADRARTEVPTATDVVVLNEAARATLAGHEPIKPVEPADDDLAGVFYTGGTTGPPKGVMLTHRAFVLAGITQERENGVDESAVYLHTSPLFHLAGMVTCMGMLTGAGTQTFVDRFSPEAFYAAAARHEVTHIMMVPSMLAMVLDSPARDDAVLQRIRRISYGAAPISAPLLHRVRESFPNAALVQYYGMTEACGASTRLRPERHVLDGPYAGKLASVGQTMATFEIRIVRKDGTDCPPGEPGEILMRGPMVMQGYWKDPEHTATTLVDGWLHSGDVGRRDEDGFITIVDRIKDMIISGGENIFSAEVEQALGSHPEVADCAVVGVPDPLWGERVHAVVVRRQDSTVTPEQLQAHCRSLIAGYKCPRSVEFRDVLPLSAVGKILKTALRADAAGRE